MGANDLGANDSSIDLSVSPSISTSISTVSATSATSVSQSQIQTQSQISADSISEYIESKISALITLAIQGSSLPLSLLSVEVKSIISKALQELSSSADIFKIIQNKEGSTDLLCNLDCEIDPLSSGSAAEISPTGCEDQSTSVIEMKNRTHPHLAFHAEWESKVRAGLERLTDMIVLGEKIKSLALREPYGSRGKNALLYEDCDSNSIWRWEALR